MNKPLQHPHRTALWRGARMLLVVAALPLLMANGWQWCVAGNCSYKTVEECAVCIAKPVSSCGECPLNHNQEASSEETGGCCSSDAPTQSNCCHSEQETPTPSPQTCCMLVSIDGAVSGVHEFRAPIASTAVLPYRAPALFIFSDYTERLSGVSIFPPRFLTEHPDPNRGPPLA